MRKDLMQKDGLCGEGKPVGPSDAAALAKYRCMTLDLP